MTVIDEQGRPEPPLAADELGTLLGFLEFHRATLEWKTAGLDAAGMSATVGPSTMTLGGLLKHVCSAEEVWFSHVLHARPMAAPWDVDRDDRDWDWNSAVLDTPEELRELWRATVERSRGSLAEALAGGGLDQLSKGTFFGGQHVNLRWILVHMIEEYGRHNGHADLLRESVDGQTGE